MNNITLNTNLGICNNCGKQGHMLYHCKLPIISYGIILFRENNNKFEYLMIRRKDSYGYIEFIRGKYSLNNIEQITILINEMTINEKQNILERSFDELWRDMWGLTNIETSKYKNEKFISRKKFETLREGINIDDTVYKLYDIVNASKTNWSETEWEFPKGRRNINEKDLCCALREFEEETGISKKNITVISNLLPFEELFIGSNNKAYKHKYFLSYINNNINKDDINIDNFQQTEVSKVEWKNIDECLTNIRTYNLEKKHLIKNINNMLQEYRLYS